jgi:hypothetical protein
MYDRKIALSHARRLRSCPPPAVVKDDAQAQNVNRHMAICPYCTASSGEKGWEELALQLKKIIQSFPPGVPAPEAAVAPGQIRYIRREKSAWRDGYHYNPPMVLVLELQGKISDELRVAQVYDDTALAAPGDLILSDEKTGAGELFVECWNTYTLKGDYLGTQMGPVSPEVLSAIQRMVEDPTLEPDWASLLFPMRDEDPRLYFRQLEIETAYTFSSRATEELMNELERPFPANFSPESIKIDILRKVPGIVFAFPSPSPEATLLTALFPADRLPMAAADSAAHIIIGKRVTVTEQRITEFEPLEIHIFKAHDHGEGKVAFSGRFQPQPASPPPVAFLCGLFVSEAGLLLPASDPTWDPSSGNFAVSFATTVTDFRRLSIAVIYEAP